MNRAFGILLIGVALLLCGCTEVVEADGAVVLKSKMYVAVVMPVLGALLLVGGTVICLKRLPEIWRSDMGAGWKGRRSKIVVIPLMGVVFLLGTFPRMSYRVEVGDDYVDFKELGNSRRYERSEIRQLNVFEQGEGRRRLQVWAGPGEGEQHYINESEIGTESFEQMEAAVRAMRKRK